MFRLPRYILALALAAPLLAACSSGGDGNRRVVPIAQADDGCTPAQIAVARGEKIKLQVQNTGKKDHEIEGTGGTKLEETAVPSGKTRTVNYDAPSKAGTQQFKCYVPNGSTTIIQVQVS